MSRSRYDFRTPRSTSLTGLELRNFKSIRSARIPIRPLTIISGSNSTGKSTLLQAILALTQVSRRRIEGGRFPLNGDLVQLGTISSLKNQHSEPDDNILVSYEFSSSIRDMRRTGGRQIGFEEKRFRRDFDVPDYEDIDSAYVKWSIELDRQFNDQIGSARIVSITIDVEGVLNQVQAEITRNDMLSDIDFDSPEEQIDEDLIVHDGWMHFTTGYGTENEPEYGERGSIDISDTTIESGQITSLRVRPSETSQQGEEWSESEMENGRAHLIGAQRVCARHLASQVHYVGPLRHAPHLPFGSAPDPDTGSVGIAGEHMAAVLQTKRAATRRFPLPSDSDKHDGQLTLEEAVNQWLRHLEMAESLTVRESAPLTYSVDLVPPGLEKAVPLRAVGVGVSQVLPVIVQCLVAGPGALVILEQPELHLHPAAQQRLADFLIACTNWGQRILVETHSEYLVLRLRRRIAMDDSDELRQQVAILFAERDEQGDTTYREVAMNEVGGVIDWPDGFFDQGQNEAHELLIAAAQRQRRTEEAAKQ